MQVCFWNIDYFVTKFKQFTYEKGKTGSIMAFFPTLSWSNASHSLLISSLYKSVASHWKEYVLLIITKMKTPLMSERLGVAVCDTLQLYYLPKFISGNGRTIHFCKLLAVDIYFKVVLISNQLFTLIIYYSTYQKLYVW